MVEQTRRVNIVFIRLILLFLLLLFVNFFVYFGYYKKYVEEPQNQLIDTTDFFRSRDLLAIDTERNNCTPAAILEFPSDGFTKEQRQKGWIVLHVILVMYCFLFLANVCEYYFVPAIQSICERLNMSEDVAGATLMAVTSSSPELFINCVGTFVTKGDIGVGTVVGSAVFNVLAVPACCGLFAGRTIVLDWWPVTRDCFMYAVSVIILIITMQDDRVDWYEALFLLAAYLFYILVMYFNAALQRICKKGLCCLGGRSSHYTDITPLLGKDKNGQFSVPVGYGVVNGNGQVPTAMVMPELDDIHVWSLPKGGCGSLLIWFISWPISALLWFTIPDVKRSPKLLPVIFFLCIVYIGGISYIVAWFITVIGDTLNIPDSVIGLTFLAAGMSVPEAVSSIIVTNQGFGGMGISNSIGSNTFDVLLCLGLPWLIKSVWFPAIPGHHYVLINSSGLSYNTISLLSTLLALYAVLALNNFRMGWRIGITCGALYIGFLVLATLVELNYFFPVNLPTCAH